MYSTVGDGYLAVLIKDGSHLRLVGGGGAFVLCIRAEPTISRPVPQHLPPSLLGRLTPRLGRYIARVRTNTVLRTKKCPTLSTIFPQNLSDRLLPVTDRRWRTD